MLIPNKLHIILLLVLMGLLIPAMAGAAIFVKWDAGGAENGSSWTDAYTDLQDALGAAASGDTIWVAAGAYTPTDSTDRYATFTLVDGVYLYGGFAGTETSLSQRDIAANETILSGEIGAPGIADNSDNVVTAPGGSTGVLDGFTIASGNATLWGGGVDNSAGDFTYVNLTIENNHANLGAGMYNTGQPTLQNVLFLNNAASSGGGGLDNSLAGNPTLNGCTFEGNSAGEGGAINHSGVGITLTNCLFAGNTASNNGGAVYCYETIQLSDCVFDSNQATEGSGGGIYLFGVNVAIENVTFTENTASTEGGGVFTDFSSSLEIYDAVFEKNQAGIGGGLGITGGTCVVSNAVFYDNAASNGGGIDANNAGVTLTNVTFHGNTVANTGGGMRNRVCNPQIINVIFWENSAGFSGNEIANFSGSVPSISYSLIRGCGGSGAGWDTNLGADGGNNIDADPLYVDSVNGNLRLVNGSPAVNAGDDGAPYLRPTDLDGNPRILGSAVDMGAYEFDPATDTHMSSPAIDRIIQRAYPNPFNPLLHIVLWSMDERKVNLAVYDVRGRLVRTLMSDAKLRGSYSVVWDGRDGLGGRAASGVYFVVMRSVEKIEVRKVTLVK